MPRVQIGAARKRKHKRIMKAASGFHGAPGRRHKLAKQKTFRAGVTATRDRRRRRRDFRRLWIVRVSAAVEQRGGRYSAFIDALNKKDIFVNRKMLSEIAIADPAAFDAIYNLAMGK